MRVLEFDSFCALPHLRERPDPAPSATGVVIAVASTGLCRSDWHGWQGHDSDITSLPHIPGHEFAGTIAEVGASVQGWGIGDRVTVPFVCGCGACPDCYRGDAQVCANQWQPGFSGPGSFAEFVAIPHAGFNLVGIPAEVSMNAAASLGCRFATAYRAAAHVGRVQPGEDVLIVGCGGVGLSLVMICLALGARVTAVDVSTDALTLAASLGANTIVSAGSDADLVKAIRSQTPNGIDLSFDAFGSIATCQLAVESLRRRGRHVQVGLLPPAEVLDRASVPMHLVIGRELSILGSHGMSASAYPEMLSLISAGRLNPESLVAREITLDETPDALVTMQSDPRAGITIIKPCA